MKPNLFALIVAGGSSTRMAGDIPKPYMPLAGMPMLRHSVNTFLAHPSIAGVRVVIRREDHARYKKAVEGLTLCPCVVGGARRQDSVRLGLEALAEHNPTHVLIHDAARPLVSPALIDRVTRALEHYAAVLPALPVADTLKCIDENGIKTIDRTHLFAAQTPQGFDYRTIVDLHRAHQHEDATDDIALAERVQLKVGIVEGEPHNFKLTTLNDFTLAESYCT
jgi:2-C-methyl-D-erythritol 4-phosphate cytidylyltransferase / 2-C-methyl-D-erythritol 2,4-cyclodiphosphate synthase